MSRALFRSAVARTPGLERPRVLSRGDGHGHPATGRPVWYESYHDARGLPSDRYDVYQPELDHRWRPRGIPPPTRRLARMQYRLGAVLARSHRSRLRASGGMGRPNPDHATERVLHAAVFCRRGGGTRPETGGGADRQREHCLVVRLSARGLGLPKGIRRVPGLAGLRRDEAQNPLGQLRPSLRSALKAYAQSSTALRPGWHIISL